jgi:hypothetical protein
LKDAKEAIEVMWHTRVAITTEKDQLLKQLVSVAWEAVRRAIREEGSNVAIVEQLENVLKNLENVN